MATLIVYGADWCEDTRRSRRHLRRLCVPHRYVNIDEDVAALERAMALNEGKRRTPTIDLDGWVLVEPSNAALTAALLERGHVTAEGAADRLAVQNIGDLERVVRIGAGVAGVLAATRMPRLLRWPIGMASAALALTGVVGWSPIYAARGLTSLDGPGDRPDEAHRREWTAPLPRVPATGAPQP